MDDVRNQPITITLTPSWDEALAVEHLLTELQDFLESSSQLSDDVELLTALGEVELRAFCHDYIDSVEPLVAASDSRTIDNVVGKLHQAWLSKRKVA